LWTKLGNKFHSIERNLIRGFSKGACGQQCIFVRQEDCLRWVFGDAWWRGPEQKEEMDG
jgi:hypothetical protein